MSGGVPAAPAADIFNVAYVLCSPQRTRMDEAAATGGRIGRAEETSDGFRT